MSAEDPGEYSSEGKSLSSVSTNVEAPYQGVGGLPPVGRPSRIIRTTRKIEAGRREDVVTVQHIVSPDPERGIVPLPEIDTSRLGVRYEIGFRIEWLEDRPTSP